MSVRTRLIRNGRGQSAVSDSPRGEGGKYRAIIVDKIAGSKLILVWSRVFMLTMAPKGPAADSRQRAEGSHALPRRV
ncbi:hypothetical protein RRG08_052005 [Elysia crispata]|uniref:Uncharacterized protein n=1 Tax=Elysia crispata TaxID=231223 RepID=A0AAE1DDV2_9GAST|nr:hypothetical protein RRG08_052005 [Elysia crispata]